MVPHRLSSRERAGKCAQKDLRCGSWFPPAHAAKPPFDVLDHLPDLRVRDLVKIGQLRDRFALEEMFDAELSMLARQRADRVEQKDDQWIVQARRELAQATRDG